MWLAKATTDLAVARTVLQRGPDMEPWAAAFHAQQAAEKAMKALLVLEGIEPERDHNLIAIKAMLPKTLNLGVSTGELARLSAYSRGVRYVAGLDMSDEPDWDEAGTAVTAAETVLTTANEQIRGR